MMAAEAQRGAIKAIDLNGPPLTPSVPEVLEGVKGSGASSAK